MQLSPRQFAEALGVSESSVRRWADSGKICMSRTAGGHRKIARAEAIRFIRETASQLAKPELLGIVEPANRRDRAQAFLSQHEVLHSALEAGDSGKVAALLQSMYVNGVTVAEIFDGPVRQAMRRIGEKWPADKRGIFLEHRATNICIDAISALRNELPPPRKTAPLALGGAPESDPYILPSLMAATVFADIGLETLNLGPNTPMDVMVQSAIEMKARIVWIALTAPLPRKNVELELQTLARKLNSKKIDLVLGGQSLGRYQIPTSSRVHGFQSLAEMVGFARSFVKQKRRAAV